jgi:hypothetical protein
MRPRHAVPAVFVATVGLAAAGAPVLRPARRLLGGVLGAYAAAAALATLRVATRASARGGDATGPCQDEHETADGGPAPAPAVLVCLPAAFATMHVAYGTGMLLGLLEGLGARALGGTRPALPPARLDQSSDSGV